MKHRSLGLAVVFVLLAGAQIVPAVSAAGRPACLVSNERTGLGSRSLQDGIDAAVPGDTLVVKGTCIGSSTVDRDLTIKGVSNQPFGPATLDGDDLGRVLLVEMNQIVTIADLTITDGYASDGNPGGGLFARMGSTTILTNMTVIGNESEIEGGGIFNETDGTMTITGSSVTGNISAPYGMGGGIGNGWHATLTITNSTVSGNSANIGGGIANLNGTATVIGSTVSGNIALQGGGISNDFGGILTMTNSSVTGNTATLASGGGIFNGSASAMTMSNSTVSDNSAASFGGGVSTYGTLTFAAPSTTVASNSAASIGGGVANAPGGTVTSGCPTALGGNVLYSLPNTPQDYVGFSCPA